MAKQFSKEDLKEWAIAHGWHLDGHGHLKKSGLRKFQVSANETRETLQHFRLKLQKTSVRFEVKRSDGSWFNIKSDYYKNLGVRPDGTLAGLGSAYSV